MRKLKKMREDDEIKNLLATKFDREVLVQLLGVNRVNLEEILRNCNYSNAFIKEANDLQILEQLVVVMKNTKFYNYRFFCDFAN